MSMANYRGVSGVVAFRPRFFDLPRRREAWKRRTEPDLDLIKQVEQVGRWGFWKDPLGVLPV